ncbi:hypothetical protein B857_02435 [Solibacillus isronensis B3W22]|uniref:Uncharacterized protein n=1 Tax=Solibacillus isronensis B3W22 TaxID=1224748 RepID=K1L2G4_9BACL|nr:MULTISPECIES: hypothetical protein [Solibacillus]AMO85231.1 hypothetical protein SOLI23_06430 [Solibacillus silvestris]EKB44808.1 hypothetical protein B857_02435 [Solibacillus isronensis B3W22]OBW55806.1 hypothetical protein A9986_12150 [Solibacillus silvestris]
MKKVFVIIAVVFIVSIPMIEWLLTNPSNSLELMQTLRSAENPESLFMDEDNFDADSVEYIQEEFSPNMVKQFTILEFDEKSFLIQTTPGTTKWEIINIEELPKEIKEYFLSQK